jgi:hypothetical protein
MELPRIIYYKTQKTGSTSIMDTIQRSKYKNIEIFNDNFEINDEQIIVFSIINKLNNIKSRNIIKKLEKLENTISFAVVRNPVDKFVSGYNFLFPCLPTANITTLLKKPINNDYIYYHLFLSQTDSLLLDNRLIPNNIIYFNNLNQKLTDFFKKHGYDLIFKNLLNQSLMRITVDRLNYSSTKAIKNKFCEDFKNFNF